MLGLRRDRNRDRSADQLRRVLGRTELPSIPAVVTAAIDRLADPESTLKEVAEVVARDPGLSARLLTAANSAVYSPRTPIVSVGQAVMMLGRNHVESMLVALAAGRVVNAVAVGGFDLAAFWRLAAWRAGSASSASDLVDRRRRAENFTAALLADVAVPLLLRCEPRYREVVERWRRGEGDLARLELAAFGWTHGVVASWMFDQWGFPEVLSVAVAEEGDPAVDDVEFPVVRIVTELNRPDEREEVVRHVARRMERVLGIDESDGIDLLERSYEGAGDLAGSFL